MKAKNKPQSVWPYYSAVIAMLVYVACEVYGPALHGPFVYDDFSLPYYNPLLRTDHLTAWIGSVRPLLMLSYWINFKLSGHETFWYHVVNLSLHLANSFAVYLIVRRLLERQVLDRSRREILAAFAAALFLLHPLQTESVAWIAGRSESLSALFYLYAFAAFLYRPSEAIGWSWSVLVLGLFAFAVACKEHTVTLPILLLLTDVLSSSENRIDAIRRNWRLYVPMLVGGLVAVIAVLKLLSRSQSAGFQGAGVSWLSYALTQCRVFFVYLRLFVFPAGQNIDYDMPWSPIRYQLSTFAGFVGIVILAVLAWKLRRRFPIGSYGFLAFLILLAPTTSFVPIKDPIAERRLYLPMLGLALVACEFLIHSIRERSSMVAVAAGLIAVSSIVTYHRNRLWGSEAALWEDTVAKSPNKLRGYGHLVHGLINEHRCREALRRLDEVSHRLPVDPPLLGHWAVAYECVHEPEHALAKLELVAAEAPTALTYVDIARNQLVLYRDQEAMQSLDRALELDATLDSAHLMRAELYERRGDLSRATLDYRDALQLNPANAQAQWRLQQITGYTLHR